MQPVINHLPWHDEASGIANLENDRRLFAAGLVIIAGLLVFGAAVGFAIGVVIAGNF